MSENANLKRVALFTAVALATAGAVLLAWQFGDILALLGMSLAVATMVRAPVEWLVCHRMPQGLALLLIYAIGLVVVIGIAWLILPHLVTELQSLAQDVGVGYTNVQTRWAEGTRLQQSLARRLPQPHELTDVLSGSTSGLAQMALGATLNVFEVAAQSLLVIIISLYWAADRLRFERLLFSLLAPAQRARARTAWHEVEAGLGAYLRSEAAQCLLAGALLSLGFWLLGLRYPFVVALFAALAWLLPLVGGAVAVIPVLLIGLFTNPTLVVVATLYTFAVFAFLEFVVERKLYPRERYGSVLVLLITIVMVEALGIVGLLIAPPLAAAIQIALTEWLRPAPVSATQPVGVSLSSLKMRLTQAQAALDQIESPSPSTQNLLERLSGLIAKVESEDKQVYLEELNHERQDQERLTLFSAVESR